MERIMIIEYENYFRKYKAALQLHFCVLSPSILSCTIVSLLKASPDLKYSSCTIKSRHDNRWAFSCSQQFYKIENTGSIVCVNMFLHLEALQRQTQSPTEKHKTTFLKMNIRISGSTLLFLFLAWKNISNCAILVLREVIWIYSLFYKLQQSLKDN